MKNTKYAKQYHQANRLYHNQTKKVRLRAKAYAKKQIREIEASDNFSTKLKARLIQGLQIYIN